VSPRGVSQGREGDGVLERRPRKRVGEGEGRLEVVRNLEGEREERGLSRGSVLDRANGLGGIHDGRSRERTRRELDGCQV
jgi:hypothetical protein